MSIYLEPESWLTTFNKSGALSKTYQTLTVPGIYENNTGALFFMEDITTLTFLAF